MPKNEADPTDPMSLHGVEIADPDGSGARAMVECIAEEFLRLGRPVDQVLALFRSPQYLLAHGAWRRLGEEEIGRIVAEQARRWLPAFRQPLAC